MVSCSSSFKFQEVADKKGIQGIEADDENELPIPPKARRRLDDLSRIIGVYQGRLMVAFRSGIADLSEQRDEKLRRQVDQ